MTDDGDDIRQAKRVVHVPAVPGPLLEQLETDNRLLCETLESGLQAVVFRAQTLIIQGGQLWVDRKADSGELQRLESLGARWRDKRLLGCDHLVQYIDDACAIDQHFTAIQNQRRHLAHRAIAPNLFFIDVGVEVEMLEGKSKQLHRDGRLTRKPVEEPAAACRENSRREIAARP